MRGTLKTIYNMMTFLIQTVSRPGADDFSSLPKLKNIFGPTGLMQELSLISGWGEAFLDLAERFDIAAAQLGKETIS